jgi:hypothetical protein
LELKRRFKLTVLAVTLISNLSAQERNITTEHIWFDFYNYFPLTQKLEYDGDLGFRHAFSDFPWSRIYIRPSLLYRWKKTVRFHGGVKFSYTFQDIVANNFEIRPWLGIKIIFPKIRRFTFRHFLRVEQRFELNTGKDEWTSQTRLRYKLGLRVPINHPTLIDKTFYVPLSIELFDNAAGDLTERFASRGRFTAGLGYRFDKKWRLEFEYTLQGSRDTRLEGFKGSDNLFHLKLRWYHSA